MKTLSLVVLGLITATFATGQVRNQAAEEFKERMARMSNAELREMLLDYRASRMRADEKLQAYAEELARMKAIVADLENQNAELQARLANEESKMRQLRRQLEEAQRQ